MDYTKDVEEQNESLRHMLSESEDKCSWLERKEAESRLIILALLKELQSHHGRNWLVPNMEQANKIFAETKRDVSDAFRIALTKSVAFTDFDWDCMKDYFSILGLEAPDAVTFNRAFPIQREFDLSSS